MKKILFLLIAVAVSLVSCEETESVVFDGSQTLVGFGSSTADLPIVINSTGSVTLSFDVSTVSSSERTFAVSVLEGSNANPGSYSIGSAVVPANSYKGELTITGNDDNVETTPKKLILQFTDLASNEVAGNPITISVYEVCPVDETAFTGMYKLEVVSGGVMFGTDILQPGMVFDLKADGLVRTFVTQDFAGFCAGTTRDFNLNFVCNEVVVPEQATTCNCSSNNLFRNGSVNGVYDATDDSEFTFVFIRDCGSGSVESVYRFVKQ